MKYTLCALSLLLATGAATASITLDYSLARAFTAGGASQVAPGTIGVLVADTFGTGLPNASELVGATLSNGSSIGDARILRVFSAFDISTGGDFGFQDTFTISDFSGMTLGSQANTVGTDLGFYWFPGITSAGSTVNEGQSYGFFRTDTVDTNSGADMSYNMPGDGFSYTLASLDTSLGGSFAPSSFQANSVAIGISPEPSRMMLLGLGLVGVFFRRRR